MALTRVTPDDARVTPGDVEVQANEALSGNRVCVCFCPFLARHLMLLFGTRVYFCSHRSAPRVLLSPLFGTPCVPVSTVRHPMCSYLPWSNGWLHAERPGDDVGVERWGAGKLVGGISDMFASPLYRWWVYSRSFLLATS